MHAILKSLALLLAAGGSSSPAPPSTSPKWEKVFDGAPSERIYAVAAVGRDDWFLALERAVAKVTKSNVERHDTMPRQAQGLYVASPTSVYALGDGEMVLHFDGKTWTEEHVGAPPPRPRRRGTGAPDMLVSAYLSDSTLVAVGPSLALLKQRDGSWTQPAKADRQKLWEAGGLGPKVAWPSGCARAGWLWLGKNRGFFFCHDRRAFVWEAGKLTAKGSIPRKCYDSLNSMAEERGEFYVACSSATMWRSQGETWQAVAEPKEKGLKEIEFMAAADGCLFATGPRSVWRACSQ
jgi:hypothetical protein